MYGKSKSSASKGNQAEYKDAGKAGRLPKESTSHVSAGGKMRTPGEK